MEMLCPSPIRRAIQPILLAASLTTYLMIPREVAGGEAAGPARVEFNRDIRPILSDNCFLCHGPDKNRRKADMRLDERASAVTMKAIVPGKPEESELLARISSEDKDEVMPPPSTHKKLTVSQQELLRSWIAQGAEYQAHWAYVPVRRPTPPRVKNGASVRNPIDAFILATLQSKGIKASPEADRHTLIRRLSLDLIGLPPTLEEVRAFEDDKSPQAYENLVDRLLESPHYGERMAVGWLDLARFTDTVGYHGDQNQRIFPYRDYVIDSFNRNKPFDQFTIEQLAGDLLPGPTTEQLVATGFNRLNMMTREGGAQPGEYLAKYAGDRVRTVGITWLGSTLGCCECHDHKYDPFTMRDFYSLQAFFADVKQWGVYSDYDYTPNPELKGWSNEHPFPPEIEVESPYLKRRQEHLRDQIRKVCRASGRTMTPGSPKKQAFDTWVDRISAFAKANPSGWNSPFPALEPGSKLEPDGSVLLADPSSKEKKNGAADTLSLRMKPGDLGLARIRLELLPHAAHGGKALQGGAESTTVQLSASIKRKDGTERPVTFFHADADSKQPRYANGNEILGVLGGWQTSRQHTCSRQTSIWYLDSPRDLAADDELKIVVRGNNLGCVRLSVSPFGFDPYGRAELGWQLRETFASLAMSRTEQQTEELQEQYILATGGDPSAFAQAKERCRDLLECRDGRTYSMITQPAQPMVVRVLPRGNWQDQSGPIVTPAVPRSLSTTTSDAGRRLNRLDLARWLVSPENPLTARVFVNRLWKSFFGAGISSVVEDVGAQGEWPIHPELLDWLAVEFRESGWNIKHMIKLVVMSSTYRRDSRLRPELHEIDPNNRLLASQSPRRLEAEFVRDNALAIAGLINLDVGGPSVFPYQPAGYYTNLQFPDRDYIADKDDRQYRRGVYMHWQRTFLHPMLANFDAPPREECTAARTVANTPQQALTLLNDPTFVEAARMLARRLLATHETTDTARIDALYQRALARFPGDQQRKSLTKFLTAQREYFKGHPTEASQLDHVGDTKSIPLADVEPGELAAWTAVCRVVLNLHESITRY